MKRNRLSIVVDIIEGLNMSGNSRNLLTVDYEYDKIINYFNKSYINNEIKVAFNYYLNELTYDSYLISKKWCQKCIGYYIENYYLYA